MSMCYDDHLSHPYMRNRTDINTSTTLLLFINRAAQNCVSQCSIQPMAEIKLKLVEDYVSIEDFVVLI